MHANANAVPGPSDVITVAGNTLYVKPSSSGVFVRGSDGKDVRVIPMPSWYCDGRPSWFGDGDWAATENDIRVMAAIEDLVQERFGVCVVGLGREVKRVIFQAVHDRSAETLVIEGDDMSWAEDLYKLELLLSQLSPLRSP